jgi:translation initiation factor 2 gamma subunit (eIF-2gamma)
LFVDAVLTRTVSLVKVPALYTRIGDVFAGACLAAAAVLVALAGRKPRVSTS